MKSSNPIDPKLDYKYEEVTNEVLIQEEQESKVLHLNKILKNFDELTAVNKLSCTLYKNQIFCLLGHNGAGKTTLINISGLLDSDGGEISMNTHNLITDKEYLFKNLGLCCQENVFFGYLTVEEHLKMMSKIKGVEDNMSEITDLLSKIELLEKKDCLSQTLSGGQQRKLCIALALVGNSKLVLLDEPTSGMDVIAKKSVWDFLKNFKKDKIIILTTHSLEEAEFLGDRIGIMSEGKMICCGTSSFLKNQYNCGFNVTFLFETEFSSLEVEGNTNNTNVEERINKNKKYLITELKKLCPELKVKVIGKETVVLNFQDVSDKYSQIFEAIEMLKEKSEVVNYTLSTTTLEDVFLKLNDNEFSKNIFEDYFQRDINIQISQEGNINQFLGREINVKPSIGLFQEVKISLKRHIISLTRNKATLVIELISSIISFLFFVFFINMFIFDKKSLDLEELNRTSTIHYGISNNLNSLKLEDYLYSKDPALQVQLYQPQKSSTIKKLPQDYDNYLYDSDPEHLLKLAMWVDQYDKSQRKLSVFNYCNPGSVDYCLSLNNLVISSFIKNEFRINNEIMVSIHYIQFYLQNRNLLNYCLEGKQQEKAIGL